MPLTSGELTLLAPLVGAPIGAIITLVATRRTSKDSLEVQRQIAKETLASQRALERDKRLYEKRSELYPQFFETGEKGNLDISEVINGGYTYGQVIDALDKAYDAVFEHFNQITAFGGQVVRSRYDSYHTLMGELNRLCVRLHAKSHPLKVGDAGEPVQVAEDDENYYNAHHDEVRDGYEAMEDAYNKTTVAMRAELQDEEPQSPPT